MHLVNRKLNKLIDTKTKPNSISNLDNTINLERIKKRKLTPSPTTSRNNVVDKTKEIIDDVRDKIIKEI